MRAIDRQARTRSLTRWADAIRAILWRLRDRHDRAASLGFFLTVCLISGTLAVIPRLVNQTINRGVVAAVSDAVRTQPGITLNLNATLAGTTNDPMATVLDDGRQFQSSMAPTIQNVVTGFSYTVESQRFKLVDPSGSVKSSRYFQTFLTLRYQSGLDRPGLVTLDSGALPKPIPPVSPSVFKDSASTLGDQPLPAFQIALDQATARALKVNLGDWVILQPDSSDSKTSGVPSAYLNYTLAGQISGIFHVPDANAHYWLEDSRLLQPSVQNDGTTIHAYGFGLIAPAAYPALVAQTSPVNWAYSWRYELDPTRVNAGNEQTLASSVRSLLLTHGSAGSLSNNPTAVSVHSPLVDALDQFHSQRTFFVSVATLATLGVLAVALLLLILVSLLVVERSASGMLLLRGRGADGRQLVGALAMQATLIALPATAIGYAAARIAIPVESPVFDLVLSITTGLIAIVITSLAVLPDVRLPLGRHIIRQRNSGADVANRTTLQARRIGVELVVVLLAAAGIYLVRRRGLVESGSNGIDPFLALVPFLAGLAAGILLLRLFPIPVQMAGRIVKRSRGIVVWAGLRRVSHRPSSAQLSMLALLVAVGVAVFSLVVEHSLTVAQSAAVWQTVGADYRIDAPSGDSLPENWNLQTISGVKSIALAYYQPDASLNDGGSTDNGTLLAIDAAAYEKVTQGSPAATQFPAALFQQTFGAGIGSQADPLPALISSNWPGNIKPGQSLQVTLASVPYWIRVSAIIAAFPSMSTDTPFVITSRAALQAANPDTGVKLPVTRVFVRGTGPDLASRLRQAIQRQAPSAMLTTRAGALANNSRQLLAGRVTTMFGYSVVLVTLFAATAGSVGLMLASAARRRDLSYLRTLGLSGRQAFGVTVVEQLPPVLSAAFVGAGLGLLVARLISPALDLSAFAGRAGVSAGMVISWWQIVALTGGISLVVFIAIVGFGVVTRNLDLASTLRLGGR